MSVISSRKTKHFTARTAMKYLGYSKETQEYILDLYNDEHRKYHNEEHIDNMLRWVDPNAKFIVPLLEAIIFHDLIYSNEPVAAGFNEAASIAVYATNSEHQTSTLLQVVEAINATAHHDKDQPLLGPVSQLLLDLDLQSFAQPRQEFLADNQRVINELTPMFGREAVIAGNTKFMERLLERKKLYYVLTDWEDIARENLRRLIESRKSGE